MPQLAEVLSAADADPPGAWLGATPLIDLEDPRLRLRVHSLTQLCQGEREKALALYGFVRRLPLARRVRLAVRTARQVLDAGRGDAQEKATLLVAMLRIAGIAARIRIVTLRGAILRGIPGSPRDADRPLLEVFVQGRWLRTDTYIYDAECMAAARQRLKDRGWDWGWGIHVNGAMVWNGLENAYLGGVATEHDPMVVGQLGLVRDELDYRARGRYARLPARLARVLHWNLLAPLMNHAWRSLRQQRTAGIRIHKTS